MVMITNETAFQLQQDHTLWLSGLLDPSVTADLITPSAFAKCAKSEFTSVTTLCAHDDVTVRQGGDEFILLEIGGMSFDISNRVRVELWERKLRAKSIPGVIYFNTCTRSSLIHFDPKLISMRHLANQMLETASALGSVRDITLDINIIRMPVVSDDSQTHEAIDHYMKTTRKEAVYLPNNCKYVARNNGLPDTAVLDALLKTPWLVIARGFFVMLPFLVVSGRAISMS
jgi:urea carboxylase